MKVQEIESGVTVNLGNSESSRLLSTGVLELETMTLFIFATAEIITFITGLVIGTVLVILLYLYRRQSALSVLSNIQENPNISTKDFEKIEECKDFIHILRE